MGRRATLRRNDDEAVAITAVDQRRKPRLTGIRPGCGEEQHVSAREWAAGDLAAVGSEIVDKRRGPRGIRSSGVWIG